MKLILIVLVVSLTGCSTMTPEERHDWHVFGQNASGAAVAIAIDILKEYASENRLPNTKGLKK